MLHLVSVPLSHCLDGSVECCGLNANLRNSMKNKDLTFTELKALPVTIKVFMNEETKAYISENWVEE